MKFLKLTLLRKKKNLTQKQLADILGYSTNGFISQIETGVRKMPQDLEIKLAELFGDLSEFYTEADDEQLVNDTTEKLVVLPKSILDDIHKLTDTIYSQQRTIEKLINKK